MPIEYTPVKKKQRIFTTGQIAKICNVAPRTVSKWHDAGKFPGGYRIPGSLDRRVPREGVVQFLKEHGMPMGELAEPETVNVLFVGLGEQLAGQLTELLPTGEDFRLEAVESLFDAGLLAHEFKPAAVVADSSLGRGELLRMARALRSNGSADALLVAVIAEDFQMESELLDAGYDEFRVRPVDVSELANRVRAGRRG